MPLYGDIAIAIIRTSLGWFIMNVHKKFSGLWQFLDKFLKKLLLFHKGEINET